MKNYFYTEFDLQRMKESSRGGNDYRSPFQIDRDRIIHSSEFRRLQGKTQVFLPGEYDFYRTRLTHSIEVAQIGRSICNFLSHKYSSIFNDEYYVDPDLVESVCLAHDLGHPPFGHAGERTIHNLMREYGGFEGNAQTLRLISQIFYREDDHHRGMNPTRALLDGVLKYKALYSDLNNPENHFLYDFQKEELNFVFEGREIKNEFDSPKDLNKFRSIECQVMDWADDTAYSVNDLMDSISGGFITIAKLSKWKDENENKLNPAQNKYVEEMIDWIRRDKFKPKFGAQIGEFISACSIEERDTFLNEATNRYKYKLVIDERVFEKTEIYKKISVELVFRSSQLHQMEYKGNFMLTKIFNLLKENYVESGGKTKLLPDFTHKLINREKNNKIKIRLICDYVSGMTDFFAMRNYKRLFDPDYSSLVDVV